MAMKKNYLGSLFLICILLFVSSCVSFSEGWGYMSPRKSASTTQNIIEEAKAMEKTASTKEDVEKIIVTYRKVEAADPYNCFALWKIGNYKLLLGAAYADNRKEKSYYYKEAIKYCEKAMFTNEAFRKAVLDGMDITEAAAFLTIDEIDAMGYWYTARFYYFKECLSPFRRSFNTRIVRDNNEIIARIDKLDPNWAGGGNYFSRGLYYIAVPERFGGSKERAAREFDKAIEVGPQFYVNRWGRAKYLYALIGNEQGYLEDLKWVASQDPAKGGNPHAWNLYFINDARKMLAERE